MATNHEEAIMKKCVVIALFLLTGCISAPKPSDQFIAQLPKSTSEKIVYDNAMTHWSRPRSFFGKDAYVVEQKQFGHNKTLITVTRYASDIPNQKPFFIVEFTEAGHHQTQINVKEGACAIQCYENFTPDVRKWLSAYQE